jgi:hypothetical protein
MPRLAVHTAKCPEAGAAVPENMQFRFVRSDGEGRMQIAPPRKVTLDARGRAEGGDDSNSDGDGDRDDNGNGDGAKGGRKKESSLGFGRKGAPGAQKPHFGKRRTAKQFRAEEL